MSPPVSQCMHGSYPLHPPLFSLSFLLLFPIYESQDSASPSTWTASRKDDSLRLFVTLCRASVDYKRDQTWRRRWRRRYRACCHSLPVLILSGLPHSRHQNCPPKRVIGSVGNYEHQTKGFDDEKGAWARHALSSSESPWRHTPDPLPILEMPGRISAAELRAADSQSIINGRDSR